MTISTQQALPNRWDVNSVGAVATMGSTGGADASDPILLAHQGRHEVYFPGNVDSFVSGPAVDIGGATSLGMVIDFGPEGVPNFPSGTMCPAGMGTSLNMVMQYVMPLRTLMTFGYANGVANAIATGPVVPVGTRYSRTTYRPNINVVVETSVDGATWVPYQTTSATGQPTTIPGPSTLVPISVGRVPYSGVNAYTGFINKVDFLVNGSIARSFDPATQIDTSLNRDAGQTGWFDKMGSFWTVNRATTGAKTVVVTRPTVMFDETNDYIQLPASDTPTITAKTGRFAFLIACRFHSNPAANRALWDCRTDNANTFFLGFSTGGSPYAIIDTPTAPAVSIVSTGGRADGRIRVFGILVDNGSLRVYDNTSGLTAPLSIAGVGDLSLRSPRIGSIASLVATVPAMEFFGAVTIKDQALTVGQLDVIAKSLLAGIDPTPVIPQNASFYAVEGMAANAQAIPNRNNFGQQAVLGATSSIEALDPRILPHTGRNYWWTPGGTSNYLGRTDGILGPPSQTFGWVTHHKAGSPRAQIFQAYGPSTHRCYEDRSADSWTFTYTNDSGGGGLTAVISIPGIGSVPWVEHQVDPAGNRVRTRISSDTTMDRASVAWGAWSSWTVLGAAMRWPAAGATGVPYFLYGGATGGGSTDMRLWVIVDGVEQPSYRVDAANQINAEGNPNAGQTSFGGWNVFRATSGLETVVVTRDVIVFDQSNDYMTLSVADRPGITQTAGKFTFLLVGRFHGNPISSAALWDARSALGSGWSLTMTTAGVVQLILNNSFTLPTAGNLNANGQLKGWGFVINEGAASVFGGGELTAPVSVAGVGGVITDATPVVGSLAFTPAGLMGAEIIGALTFKNQALTLSQLNAYTASIIEGTF